MSLGNLFNCKEMPEKEKKINVAKMIDSKIKIATEE